MNIEKLVRESEWQTARAFGAELHRRLGSPAKPQAAAYGTYVLNLTKGDRTRWQRPDARKERETLAEMLVEDVDEVFPECAVAPTDAAFGVFGWRALRPFAPGEPYVEVGELADGAVPTYGGDRELPGFLATCFHFDRGPNWICAPAGTGKSFAVALAAAARRPAYELRKLSDLAGHVDFDGGLVAVAEQDPDADEKWLGLLETTKSTVLASFLCPASADFQPEANSFPHPFPGGNDKPRKNWYHATWQPSTQCRRSLIAWTKGRVRGESLLAGKETEAADWFDRVDPGAKNLGDPASILWILGQFDAIGPRKFFSLGLRGLVERWVEALVARHQANQSDVGAWLRTAGLATLETSVCARLESLALPLEGPLLRSQWETLLPVGQFTFTEARHAVTKSLGGSGDDAAKAEHAAMTLLALSPGRATDYLLRSGLLSVAGAGKLTLRPPWISADLTRGILDVQVAGLGASWGKLCFDWRRREEVDAALDRLVAAKPAAFRTVVAHLASLPSTADEIGKVQACFAAVARAAATGNTALLTDAARDGLLSAQFSTCFQRYANHLPMPLSRQGHRTSRDAASEWFASCWTWSFELGEPSFAVPAHLVWLFPGWCRPALATFPRELWTSGDTGDDSLSRYLRRMCQDQPDFRPDESSTLDLATAWATARIFCGQPLGDVAKLPISFEQIARALSPVAPEDPVWVARAKALLMATTSGTSWKNAVNVDAKLNPLGRVFLAVVDGPFAVEMAQARGMQGRSEAHWYLPMLPQKAHLAVVQWAFADPASGPFYSLVEGPDISLEALHWLAMQFAATQWPIVRAWAVRDPEAALEWLVATHWHSPAWHAVVGVLTRDQTDRLLAWVEGQPAEARPAEVGNWAGFVLERRPDLADRLLPFIRAGVA